MISVSSRIALMVSRDLVLDLLKTTDKGVNAIDAIIMANVIQANVDAAISTPRLQVEFGALNAIPPDSMRRPISINRLAQILQMPFETVRRHVVDLIVRGRLEMADDGVYAPTAHFQRKARIDAVENIDAVCAQAYRQLASVGFFDEDSLSAPKVAPEAPPVRAVARLTTEFALRIMPALIQVAGDYMSAVTLMQMNQTNTGELRHDLGSAAELASTGADFDRPPQAGDIVRSGRDLRFALETTRRRVIRLEELGLCRKVRMGYIVPRRVIAPIVSTYAQPNEANLRRLFRSCAEIGAVDFWRTME